jgi:hypothetical protein
MRFERAPGDLHLSLKTRMGILPHINPSTLPDAPRQLVTRRPARHAACSPEIKIST